MCRHLTANRHSRQPVKVSRLGGPADRRVSEQVRGSVVPGGFVRRVLRRIPDGKSLLVDVTAPATEGDQPIGEAVTPRSAETDLHRTPQIVVHEEEEELLGVPRE